MSATRVAILNVSDLQFGPATLAALSEHFGERPLEIILWDDSDEILEVMDRLARWFFELNSTPHLLRATTDLREAILNAEIVIACRGDIEKRVERLTAGALKESTYRAEALIIHAAAESLNVPAMPLQLLRWLNKEDYPWQFMQAHRGVLNPVLR